MPKHIGWSLLLLLACARPVAAQNATRAGELSSEPATLLSLGFDWAIAGDDNRNARVDVTYRKQGTQAWKPGLPLLRLQHEWVNGGPPQAGDDPLNPRYPFDYIVPNMFSGSLLNLEPDTAYEARFVLSDPDGVRGRAVRTVTVRTRKEPMPAAGGRTYHVYPVDWTLRPGSAAIDAGVLLPSINDDFTGRAPDIGAYEVGRPVPHYGPRP